MNIEVLSTLFRPRAIFSGRLVTHTHTHTHTCLKQSDRDSVPYRNGPRPRTRPLVRSASAARGQSACSRRLWGYLLVRAPGPDQQQLGPFHRGDLRASISPCRSLVGKFQIQNVISQVGDVVGWAARHQ